MSVQTIYFSIIKALISNPTQKKIKNLHWDYAQGAVIARNPERGQHSGKTELDRLLVQHTDAVHPLLQKKKTEQGSLIVLWHKDTNVWKVLPKLSLIKGERTALQLMGGYWKVAPTDAKGVRAVLTRAGWKNCGPR